jgi:hypothetical protein
MKIRTLLGVILALLSATMLLDAFPTKTPLEGQTATGQEAVQPLPLPEMPKIHPPVVQQMQDFPPPRAMSKGIIARWLPMVLRLALMIAGGVAARVVFGGVFGEKNGSGSPS